MDNFISVVIRITGQTALALFILLFWTIVLGGAFILLAILFADHSCGNLIC